MEVTGPYLVPPGEAYAVCNRAHRENQPHEQRLKYVRFMHEYRRREREMGEAFNESEEGWSLYVELLLAYDTCDKIAAVYEEELRRRGLTDAADYSVICS